jgi:hypothetical protein
VKNQEVVGVTRQAEEDGSCAAEEDDKGAGYEGEAEDIAAVRRQKPS